MAQKTIKGGGTGSWHETTISKGHDQARVCAERHEATGYLCTRDPKHKGRHVAHTGADAHPPTALVEWEG